MNAVAYHVPFDTLKFVETLTHSGMPISQAKALLAVQKKVFEEALDNNLGNLATKSELKTEIFALKTELKAEISELRTELKAEIAELRTKLKTEIAELRTELKTEIAELRAELKAEIAELRAEVRLEIDKLKVEMVYMRWMLGILILGVGSLVIKAFL